MAWIWTRMSHNRLKKSNAPHVGYGMRVGLFLVLLFSFCLCLIFDSLGKYTTFISQRTFLAAKGSDIQENVKLNESVPYTRNIFKQWDVELKRTCVFFFSTTCNILYTIVMSLCLDPISHWLLPQFIVLCAKSSQVYG